MMVWLIVLGFTLLASIVGGAVSVATALLGTDILGTNPAPFWAALVAATSSIAALALGKFAELGLDQQRRRREQREMMVALEAEIRSNLVRQRKSSALAHRKKTFDRLQSIRRAEENLKELDPDLSLARRDEAHSEATRFGVSDATNYVFDSIKDRVYLLPDGIIEHIVTYYNLDGMLNLVYDRSQTPEFNRLKVYRRVIY